MSTQNSGITMHALFTRKSDHVKTLVAGWIADANTRPTIEEVETTARSIAQPDKKTVNIVHTLASMKAEDFDKFALAMMPDSGDAEKAAVKMIRATNAFITCQAFLPYYGYASVAVAAGSADDKE